MSRNWRADFERLSTARRALINLLAGLGAVLWLLAVLWIDSNLVFVLITLATVALIASLVVFRSSAR